MRIPTEEQFREIRCEGFDLSFHNRLEKIDLYDISEEELNAIAEKIWNKAYV